MLVSLCIWNAAFQIHSIPECIWHGLSVGPAKLPAMVGCQTGFLLGQKGPIPILRRHQKQTHSWHLLIWFPQAQTTHWSQSRQKAGRGVINTRHIGRRNMDASPPGSSDTNYCGQGCACPARRQRQAVSLSVCTIMRTGCSSRWAGHDPAEEPQNSTARDEAAGMGPAAALGAGAAWGGCQVTKTISGTHSSTWVHPQAATAPLDALQQLFIPQWTCSAVS